MRRGDLATVALQGDYSKPRPALVIQDNRFADAATVTVLLVSATLIDAPLFRIDVAPTPSNGLRAPSQIMVDKAMTVGRARLGAVVGRLDDGTMLAVERSLALWLGLVR